MYETMHRFFLNFHICAVAFGILLYNKCGHRNVLSKRQVWMSIFHIINFKKEKKNHGHRGPGFFLIKN